MKNSILRSLIVILLGAIALAAGINLDQLYNYSEQGVPNYINKDNTGSNVLDDKIATLGRVLFYDKNLSLNKTVSCNSCHVQAFAFGDTAKLSVGLNGNTTARHSMRLINARFADETKFFWDERAESLEAQTSKPIQDHIEMGFSGEQGNPDISALLARMDSIEYYDILFPYAFGDDAITEERLQIALAQFVRSIQSFDSKFDEGLEGNNGDPNGPFTNFSPQENMGKNIYMGGPAQMGGKCQACHRIPETDIDPKSGNNGVVDGPANGSKDYSITRAPSLRDLFNPSGELNGPLMHTGEFSTMMAVIDHYNELPDDPNNPNLDPRLREPNGDPQRLNLDQNQKEALVAFLKTLSGRNVYTDEKWSDPFDENGNLDVEGVTSIQENASLEISMYPNPSYGMVNWTTKKTVHQIRVYNSVGNLVHEELTLRGSKSGQLDLAALPAGVYMVQLQGVNDIVEVKRLVIK